MDSFYLTPFSGEILQHQPAVAMFRRFFAAQQNRGDLEQRPVHVALDFALAHQRQETALVFFPSASALLVAVEHLLGGGEQRLVYIFRFADLAEKELQIVFLGEAGQLRGVV
jgi:hypothetical protein